MRRNPPRLPAILAACLLGASAVPVATAANDAQRPNVLFIAIDDLRNHLGAFGVEWAKTPNLDAFAQTSRAFTHHYVTVPTCGAARYGLLSGRRPTHRAHLNNGGVMHNAEEWVHRSLPGIFQAGGYRTYALGKISHHPGGLTGGDWDRPPEEMPGVWDRHWIPDGPWEHARSIMHGYANGVPRRPGRSPAIEAHDGPDESYPDAWVAKDAVAKLEILADSDEPWFFGVGFFKPHLPFAAPKRDFDTHEGNVPDLEPEIAARRDWPSGWHNSGEFRRNYGHPGGRDPETHPEYARELREAYTATVTYMDRQLGRVFEALEETGLADDTIVVVWSDHGFLLGEHAIWGKHCLYEHSLRCPLMIRYPGMTAPGEMSDAIVKTIDILPTLADLAGLPVPDEVHGSSLRPQLDDPAAPSGRPALGYWGGQRTIRDTRWRLIVHRDGDQVELFDYDTDPYEIHNHAEAHPAVVEELRELLESTHGF